MRKIKIAIVDDDDGAVLALKDLLNRYAKEENVEFSIMTFNDGQIFLNHLYEDFDLVFLDVQLPVMSGMEVAKKIRETDYKVAIIFETEFGQYALQGYKYDAMDYFIKPISYYDLKLRMSMFFKAKNLVNNAIQVKIKGGLKYLTYDSILYIEVDGHGLVFHTREGEFASTKRESLSKMEESLEEFSFARCSSSFLVNLSQCSGVMEDKVKVGDIELEISRGMRKAFLEKLKTYQRKDIN